MAPKCWSERNGQTSLILNQKLEMSEFGKKVVQKAETGQNQASCTSQVVNVKEKSLKEIKFYPSEDVNHKEGKQPYC